MIPIPDEAGLPCPFCGSNRIDDEQGETYRWRRAYCVDCGARGGEVRTQVTGSGANTRALAEARRDAFHEWNTRVGVQYEIDVALASQQQRQAAPEWISVETRLPKESAGTVAVLFDDGEPGVAWATYWHGASAAFAQWSFPLDDLADGRSVTHWMPLPAPPLATPKE